MNIQAKKKLICGLSLPLIKGTKYIDHGRVLEWLVNQLNAHETHYQIVGGMAARAYGVKRDLVDIDLYIDFSTSCDFLKSIEKYIYWGPNDVVDGPWKIRYLKMNYEGQKIEIGDIKDAAIFDHKNKVWVDQNIDLAASVKNILLGIEVSVMPRTQLIDYKHMLDRDVDRQDIAEMAEH